MKQIDLMIFDLDGTLIDSGNDIASAVNYTLKEMSVPLLKRGKITGYVGDGVKILIERSIGEENIDRLEEALDIFIAYYTDHILDTTDLYPGVRDVLRHFENKKKIIVTNKIYRLSSMIANELKIEEYFEEIIGRNSAPYKKPDPALLVLLAQKYSADIGRTVVIGDGLNDIKLAKNSNAISCALLNGLGIRDRLLELNPDYSCEDISELKELFY